MKLKKRLITKRLQKVRLPQNMTLRDFTLYYINLTKKYLGSYKLNYNYRDGSYWIVERRMETNVELAQRQKLVDKRKARMLFLRKQLAAERARERAIKKAQEKRNKNAQLNKKVEEFEAMVGILKGAGYNIVKNDRLGAKYRD